MAQDDPSGEKQKVSEGQYVRLKDNLRVPGSEQKWILWRLPSGDYELEDHFSLVNPADRLLAQLSTNLSPELRRELQSAASQTDLIVRTGPDHKPQYLTVRGKKLVNGQTVDVLKCEADAKEVRCKGGNQNARLRLQEPEEFFYAFPFPMLLSAWSAQLMIPSTASSQGKLAVLEAVFNSADKLNLMQCERVAEAEEDETVTIGDHQFLAHKVKIKLRHENQTVLELTVWYGTPGLVYAMEGGGPTGERMALVEYKRYSDF